MPLALTIMLKNPPTGATYALQKGSGNHFQSVQAQQSKAGEDLKFNFDADVTMNADNGLDFKGPYIQGPKNARFIYIGIGLYAGIHGEPWDRRLKIPLTGITTNMIEKGYLETTVPGAGKDGTPNCATVKPFAGWQ